MAQPKKHYNVKVIFTPVSKELAAIKREAVLSVIVQATLRRLREKAERNLQKQRGQVFSLHSESRLTSY